jgi:hypothetical protein
MLVPLDVVQAARRLESELTDHSVWEALGDPHASIIYENQYELFQLLLRVAQTPVKVRKLGPHEAGAAVAYVRQIAQTEDPSAVFKLQPPTHQVMTSLEPQVPLSGDEVRRYRECIAAAAGMLINPAPGWLFEGLYTATGELARGMRADVLYPVGRKKFCERLQAVAQDAELLADHVEDQSVLVALRDIVEKVRQAIERIPRKQGRQKYYPTVVRTAGDGQSALPFLREMDFAALLASVAWRLVKDVWPGAKNPTVHAICDRLWAAAGGDIDRQKNVRSLDSSRDNSIWVRHLKAVRPHQNGSKAIIVKRILEQRRLLQERAEERSTIRGALHACEADGSSN